MYAPRIQPGRPGRKIASLSYRRAWKEVRQSLEMVSLRKTNQGSQAHIRCYTKPANAPSQKEGPGNAQGTSEASKPTRKVEARSSSDQIAIYDWRAPRCRGLSSFKLVQAQSMTEETSVLHWHQARCKVEEAPWSSSSRHKRIDFTAICFEARTMIKSLIRCTIWDDPPLANCQCWSSLM